MAIIMSRKVSLYKHLFVCWLRYCFTWFWILSQKMSLVFNTVRVFNLITLTYMKCYTNLSWNLTNYINQYECFLLWLFSCFYFCQVIKISRIIIKKSLLLLLNISFWLVWFLKCLRSTKVKVKCYKCFISLEFSESIKKKVWRISKCKNI